MTYEAITNLIKSKKNNIDNETLKFFSNYFFVAVKKRVIPTGVTLESLIDNALIFASKIELYDENHRIYKEQGGDVKGFRDPESKTIFIRSNLEEPLKEITVYHELHHAVQTNPENNEVGINQVSNIGRLIMEAQTQYFAEVIFEEMHGVKFEEREIPSEKLRMSSGGVVVSKLHNYEMYDNLLTKIAIILEVTKDYFVSINYLYKNNLGLKLLAEKYKVAKKKYQLPYEFNQFLLYYDYAYCVDLLAYKDNQDKQTILNGGITQKYEIHPNKDMELSLANQQYYLSQIDGCCFLNLAENGGNYRDFAKYIIDNQKRSLAMQYIASFEEPNPAGVQNKM